MVVVGGLYVVEGLFLNGMVLSCSDLVNTTPLLLSPAISLLCPFVIHRHQLQATSAGMMGFVCRGLLLQMPLRLTFICFSVNYNLTWQLSRVPE